MQIVVGFPGYFLSLIHGFGQFQLIEAVVIALFFGLAARSIVGAVFLPMLSAIVFLAVDCVLPAVLHHVPIAVPAFDFALLEKGVALYVVFLAASGVVFAIKKAILAFRH